MDLCCIEGNSFEYPIYLSSIGWLETADLTVARTRTGDLFAEPNVKTHYCGFRFEAEVTFIDDEKCDCACCSFKQDVQSVIITDVQKVHPRARPGLASHRDKAKTEDDYGGPAYGYRTATGLRASADGYFDSKETARAVMLAALEDIGGHQPSSGPKTRTALKDWTNAIKQREQAINSDARTKIAAVRKGQTKAQKARNAAERRRQTKRTRSGGCYYWMIDQPHVAVVPGQKTYALWQFFGMIKKGGNCAAISGSPKKDQFLVAMLADWTHERDLRKATGKPHVQYEFILPRGLQPLVLFGDKVDWGTIGGQLRKQKNLRYVREDDGVEYGITGDYAMDTYFLPALRPHGWP